MRAHALANPVPQRVEIVAARAYATSHASNPVQWGTLAGLEPIVQVGEAESADDVMDETQCGATSLVAALGSPPPRVFEVPTGRP